jgi:hypothetical protein
MLLEAGAPLSVGPPEIGGRQLADLFLADFPLCRQSAWATENERRRQIEDQRAAGIAFDAEGVQLTRERVLAEINVLTDLGFSRTESARTVGHEYRLFGQDGKPLPPYAGWFTSSE